MAARAGLLDRKETLLHAHLTMTGTGGAGGRAGSRFCAGAVAGFAFRHRRDAYLCFGAPCRLFERDLEVVAQVRAALYAAAPAAASAAEDVPEDVGKIETLRACAERAASTHSALECGVAVLVIGSALLRVAQYFISFLRFLEMFLGFRIVRIAVGVMLHRQLAISLFDIFVRSIAVDAENFIVVFFCHIPGIEFMWLWNT